MKADQDAGRLQGLLSLHSPANANPMERIFSNISFSFLQF